MQRLLQPLRRIGGRLILALAALVGRARDALRRRGTDRARRRRDERGILPSLYALHPGASSAPRRRIGLRSVPVDRVVGTARHPSQNTADFLPLPHLRGQNWHARWQRITRATDRLATLPPVELLQVGDDYFVVDGHNRIAAARRARAVEVDADVTQLLIPGIEARGQARLDASSLIGADEVRLAATGRRSRTVEQRSGVDAITRRDLLGDEEPNG